MAVDPISYNRPLISDGGSTPQGATVNSSVHEAPCCAEKLHTSGMRKQVLISHEREISGFPRSGQRGQSASVSRAASTDQSLRWAHAALAPDPTQLDSTAPGDRRCRQRSFCAYGGLCDCRHQDHRPPLGNLAHCRLRPRLDGRLLDPPAPRTHRTPICVKKHDLHNIATSNRRALSGSTSASCFPQDDCPNARRSYSGL